MTIKEAREAILDWMTTEYVFDDGYVIELDEDDRKIAIAYCQYDNEVVVEEQWYADLIDKELYLELNGLICIIRKFDTLEALLDAICYDFLIGDADNYIEEHLDEFKED